MDGSIIGLLVAGALREGPVRGTPMLAGSPGNGDQVFDFQKLLGLVAGQASDMAEPTVLPFELPAQQIAPPPTGLGAPILLPAQPLAVSEVAGETGTALPPPADSGRTLALLLPAAPVQRLAMSAGPSVITAGSSPGAEGEVAEDSALLMPETRSKSVISPRQAPEALVNLSSRLPSGEPLVLAREFPDSIEMASPARVQLPGSGQAGVGYAPVAQLQLAPPLQHPGWNRALGHQLQWMVGQRLQEAEIRLNPPQLGPLEIKISMQQDQANVSFLSHHGQVREAVEQALPRLREMLAEQGVGLGDVDVSERSLAEQRPRGEQSAQWSHSAAAGGDEGAGDAASAPVARVTVLGLLDVFA